MRALNNWLSDTPLEEDSDARQDRDIISLVTNAERYGTTIAECMEEVCITNLEHHNMIQDVAKLYEVDMQMVKESSDKLIEIVIEELIDDYNINIVGTCAVLQCAREAGVKRVMYSSTSSGYGMNEPPNVETQNDDCLNPYSVSKVNGEKLCKMYTDLFGLPTVIFRYFNVYGERQPLKGQYAPVIGIFLRQRDAGDDYYGCKSSKEHYYEQSD